MGRGIPLASGQYLCPELVSSHMSFPHLGDKRKTKAPGAREPINKTEKPPGLLERLLVSFTDRGDTVVDYTAGSGAMVKHAMALGRNVVAYERDARQYALLETAVQSFVDNRRAALSRPIRMPKERGDDVLQPVNKIMPGIFPTQFTADVVLDVGEPPQPVLFTMQSGKYLPGEGGAMVCNDPTVPLVSWAVGGYSRGPAISPTAFLVPTPLHSSLSLCLLADASQVARPDAGGS